MAHIGFTPQSEHALGGYRVQGRGDAADDGWSRTRTRCRQAGAFAVVLEMVPADVAERVTDELRIPTIGIGAGPDCDAQVLVWQDMAGLRGGPMPRFVKQYADLRGDPHRRGPGLRRRGRAAARSRPPSTPSSPDTGATVVTSAGATAVAEDSPVWLAKRLLRNAIAR